MIGLIKRNFIHMDSRTYTVLYEALVRPYVEYANSVWSPYKKRDIEAIGWLRLLKKFKREQQN